VVGGVCFDVLELIHISHGLWNRSIEKFYFLMGVGHSVIDTICPTVEMPSKKFCGSMCTSLSKPYMKCISYMFFSDRKPYLPFRYIYLAK